MFELYEQMEEKKHSLRIHHRSLVYTSNLPHALHGVTITTERRVGEKYEHEHIASMVESNIYVLLMG